MPRAPRVIIEELKDSVSPQIGDEARQRVVPLGVREALTTRDRIELSAGADGQLDMYDGEPGVEEPVGLLAEVQADRHGRGCVGRLVSAVNALWTRDLRGVDDPRTSIRRRCHAPVDGGLSVLGCPQRLSAVFPLQSER